MNRPGFQLSVRNLLWAITWIAIWFGANGVIYHSGRTIFLDTSRLSAFSIVALGLGELFGLFVAPFAAAGSIFGQMMFGIRIGLFVAIVSGVFLVIRASL